MNVEIPTGKETPGPAIMGGGSCPTCHGALPTSCICTPSQSTSEQLRERTDAALKRLEAAHRDVTGPQPVPVVLVKYYDPHVTTLFLIVGIALVCIGLLAFEVARLTGLIPEGKK